MPSSPNTLTLLAALVFSFVGNRSLAEDVTATTASDAPCTDVVDCLQRVGDPPEGPLEQQRLAEHIVTFGEAATPELVKLLTSPAPDTANLAAMALSKMPSIESAHLPEIIAALDLDLQWLPSALVRVGSEEAAAEAVRRLLNASESHSDDHQRWATVVARFGAPVIPLVMASFDCEPACLLSRSHKVGEVLRQLEPPARVAAVPAVQRALEDWSESDEGLRAALWLVSAVGRPALSTEPVLAGLLQTHPKYQWAINDALNAIGSELAAINLSKHLDKTPSNIQLRDLAALGPAAAQAEPSVVRALARPDPELQTAAARALGFMGSDLAIQPLIAAMNKPGFPVLNAVAAESLGRLSAAEALSALTQTSTRHWHPRVRYAAQRALVHLESGEPYPLRWHPDNFPVEFFDFRLSSAEIPNCAQPTVSARPESPELKRDSRSHPAWLAHQTYTLDVFADDDEDNPANWFAQDILATPHTPHLALRVAGGWLLGANRGEWGGELVFAGDDGRKQGVLGRNVEDIYRLGPQTIALVGLAHMGSNEGVVYRLRQAGNGEWSAEPWLQLPGAPNSSWPVDTGEILVNTHGGGTILIAADGRMRMAPCLDPPPIEETRQL